MKSFLIGFILLLCSFNLLAGKIQTDVVPLKDVYANDFTFGCLLSYKHVGFSSDPYVTGQSSVVEANGGYLIKYHMNSMSPGNNMKTAYTVDLTASAAAYKNAGSSQSKDSLNVNPKVKFNGDLIAQLNWAERQGFTFRGHTLVWHSSAPLAFFKTGYTDSGNRVSKEVMIDRMENYIKEVIRLLHENWPGLLSAMDVINECINDNGTFRTSSNEWYNTFGDDSYVMKAFEFARKYTVEYGETQMKLYYNDYSTDKSSKADGIVELVTPIYQAGLLDGIGMQEHSSLTFPSAAEFINSYNKFFPVCDEMAVTELDISTGSGTNTPSASILETQANQYANLFKCFVERSYFSGRGKIINVSKDGLNDKHTFVTNQSSSLWDADNQCKPAFYAVVNVGMNYNKLDSLISYAEKLIQSEYSVEEWSDIQDAISYARKALARNYSGTVSASEGLEDAINYLLNPLKTGIDDNRNEILIKSYDFIINIENVPMKSIIQVFGLNGSLLQSYISSSSYVQIPFIKPCILRITSGNEVKVYKVFNGK